MITKQVITPWKKFSNNIILHFKTLTMSGQRIPIFSFAFLDLETTGLPFQENNRTKITELNISIVESEHLCLGAFPRVRNKLSLCLNPCKFISPEATDITGLSNDLLEHQSHFSSEVINTINDFLNLHKKPICLVAHNGNQFDYPILRAEIGKLKGRFPEGILCVDSLLCFKDLHRRQELSDKTPTVKTSVISLEEPIGSPVSETTVTTKELPSELCDDFDEILCDAVNKYEESIKMQNIQRKNETTPVKQMQSRKFYNVHNATQTFSTVTWPRVSFKLEDVYKRLTSKTPDNSHNAEADVEYLIHCAAKYGEKFITWANENAKLFEDIPPMRPGRRLGF